MATIIICLLAVGYIMEDIPRENPLHTALYNAHKSFGVTILLLCLLRIYYRVRLGVPALPAAIPAIEQKLAHTSHYLFYVLMICQPLSGYLMTNFFGFPVMFFGIYLPKVVGANKEIAEYFVTIHTIIGYTFVGLIALHVTGALKHYITERINLFQRMI